MHEINALTNTDSRSLRSPFHNVQTLQPSMNKELALAPPPHTESEVLCFGLLNTTNVWGLSYSVMVFQYTSRTEKDMCLTKRLA